MERYKFEILVGLLYPKIDSAVSSHTNHLLKAPFNIHSASMLLSVPVNPEEFDIEQIPSIQKIISGEVLLHEYLSDFKNFISRLKRSEQGNEEVGLKKREHREDLQRNLKRVKKTEIF